MDSTALHVAVFILVAGGRSTRMDADKAFIALDGRTLLARRWIWRGKERRSG